ncbi:hypothetical protein FA95DRAFT_1490735 [Auriscalpium vulgare]|uniref:Uncharacterized protein n=1 Tax=Auriscalpium vulgare TaxID=40419 RepID=A0ACB8RXB4_9AGAM|nr:hypothetical protein FA95DRAFT_1490735 [Auriscalpium vulgare]
MSSHGIIKTGIAPTIRKDVLTVPGATPDSKALVEHLLEQDREAQHCFYGPGFHNHRSHHLLAAYDLGASSAQLQAIYDAEQDSLLSVFAIRKEKRVERQDVVVQESNWKQFLGEEKYYANYLTFFADEVRRLGGFAAFEHYVYSPSAAHEDGGQMTERFVGGVLHPLIQMGYAVEFGSDAMVAQALAQTAVTSAFSPQLFAFEPKGTPNPTTLFGILEQMYASPIMKPVMPYDPDALIGKRFKDALTPERIAEIHRLASLWNCTPETLTPAAVEQKSQELFFAATVIFAGTGRDGRAPRLDFFLMHLLTSALFVPRLLAALSSPAARARLLNSYLPVLLAVVLMRGRPRINVPLLMSYPAAPTPPSQRGKIFPPPPPAVWGRPGEPAYDNTWAVLLPHVLPARDSHTLKAFRALYHAAQRYATVPQGAFGGLGEGVDGSVFVRAAGVMVDVMGWVGLGEGQEAGHWDRSGLGWDAAWDEK